MGKNQRCDSIGDNDDMSVGMSVVNSKECYKSVIAHKECGNGFYYRPPYGPYSSGGDCMCMKSAAAGGSNPECKRTTFQTGFNTYRVNKKPTTTQKPTTGIIEIDTKHENQFYKLKNLRRKAFDILEKDTNCLTKAFGNDQLVLGIYKSESDCFRAVAANPPCGRGFNYSNSGRCVCMTKGRVNSNCDLRNKSKHGNNSYLTYNTGPTPPKDAGYKILDLRKTCKDCIGDSCKNSLLLSSNMSPIYDLETCYKRVSENEKCGKGFVHTPSQGQCLCQMKSGKNPDCAQRIYINNLDNSYQITERYKPSNSPTTFKESCHLKTPWTSLGTLTVPMKNCTKKPKTKDECLSSKYCGWW